ncbi:hypothetical protein TSUD_363360 [Trifolium subterraneum]|uniref:Uncharacterized protein n=1 Tax=Trifolium subterraneum TaxID=3900 RepID=A0A2Z6NAY9_TRISU|nr:hypothetical protein TSUD_363360 [Trifolium subterraneum]
MKEGRRQGVSFKEALSGEVYREKLKAEVHKPPTSKNKQRKRFLQEKDDLAGVLKKLRASRCKNSVSAMARRRKAIYWRLNGSTVSMGVGDYDGGSDLGLEERGSMEDSSEKRDGGQYPKVSSKEYVSDTIQKWSNDSGRLEQVKTTVE